MTEKNGRNKARPLKPKKLTQRQQFQSQQPSKATKDGTWKMVRGVMRFFPK